MATQAYRIVSDYTLPSNDENTVEEEAVLSANIDALWESEAGPSRISLKRRIPPRFVAATNPQSVVDQVIPSSHPIKLEPAENISSWYAGLSRTNESQVFSELRQPPTSTAVPTPTPAMKLKASQSTKNDWFIRRALSNVSADTPPAKASNLADMLEQSPPSLRDPLQPPVFLHLNPTNRGWGMLQRHGWEEGQPLGLGASTLATPIPKDPIVADGTVAPQDEESTDTSRTALITPLRTTLKVDKRGIGPKSKSFPRPTVTHSEADIRMAAEKARRERDGRGRRGFARAAKREAQERSMLLQELK